MLQSVFINILLTIYSYIFSLTQKVVAIVKSVNTLSFKQASNVQTVPKSVNYHFTRQCNYECGFCFHTAKTTFQLNLEDAKKGLQLLKVAGMEKINFSGGEPFLADRGRYLGELVKYSKAVLNLPSVTIVTNGSLVYEKWFIEYGEYLDIIAVSCDSFNESTNQAIGRGQNGRNHIEHMLKIRNWCTKYNVLFKINTVVNTYNYDENMAEAIEELAPIRWKVFQCLLLEGENKGPDALKNAEAYYIDAEKFNLFLQNHKNIKCLVPESNIKMQNSYLILDEYMRFLDCQSGSKSPSLSILDIGVINALKFSGFDEVMFKKRGGIYKWSKADQNLEW